MRFLPRIKEIGFDQKKAIVTSSYGDIMLEWWKQYGLILFWVYWSTNYIFFLRNSPQVGQAPLIHEVYRSHTTTHHSR
jgi:hypothetical protein